MDTMNHGQAVSAKYLVLGHMPADASPETHIAAGEWCFLEREDIFPDWETTFEVAPRYSPDFLEHQEALHEALGWGCALLHEYAAERNSDLPSPLSPYVWEVLYGTWLTVATPILLQTYRQYELLLRSYGHLDLTVQILPESAFTLFRHSTMVSWWPHSMSAERMYWHLSRLFELQCPETWRLAPDCEAPQPFVASAVMTPSERLKLWTQCKLGKIPPQGLGMRAIVREAVKYGIDHLADALPVCRTRFLSVRQRFLISLGLLANRKRRPQRYILLRDVYPCCTDIPQWFRGLFWTFLPEFMRNMEEEVRPRRGFFSKRIAVTYAYDRKTAVQFASHVAAEKEIFGIQHSPFYGLLSRQFRHVIEETRHAGFISWGHSRMHPNNTIPLPPLGMAATYNTHREKEPVLYFSMNGPSPFWWSHMGYGPSCKEFRCLLTCFINSLSPAVRKATMLRPYPHYTGAFDQDGWIKSRFPDIRMNLDDARHLEWLPGCRISITDYLSSVPGQSFIFNTPTVLIVRQRDYDFASDEGKRLYDAMYAVKIAHATHVDAATFVNGVWDSVPAWWYSKPVQDVRAAYLDFDAAMLDVKRPLWVWMKTVAAM